MYAARKCCVNQIRLITCFKFVIAPSDLLSKYTNTKQCSNLARIMNHTVFLISLFWQFHVPHSCSFFFLLGNLVIVRLDYTIYLGWLEYIFRVMLCGWEKNSETLLRVAIDRSGFYAIRTSICCCFHLLLLLFLFGWHIFLFQCSLNIHYSLLLFVSECSDGTRIPIYKMRMLSSSNEIYANRSWFLLCVFM